MASQVTLKALGLNYSPNNLSLPEGSLVVANDVIVRRDNVIESRRGFEEYSENFGDINSRSKQIISYKERILNHFSTVLQYATGTLNAEGKEIFQDFNSVGQEFNETQAGLRIKSIEANKNLYFTTSEGIKKISARTAEDFKQGMITNAGAVKAIDFTAELNITQGQQLGFLGFDSAVAYRILWGYKDLNDNLILGAPSNSVSVYNYLSDVCSLDINALCLALDKLVQDDPTYYSVIHNIETNAAGDESFPFTSTFSDKFYTKTTDSAETMRTNLVNVAKYIDRFGLLADINQITQTKPLQISTLEVKDNTGIVTFEANNASEYATSLNNPFIAMDASNNMYIADSDNHVIKKIPAGGGSPVIFAGTSGVSGNVNNTIYSVPNTDVAIGAVTTIKITAHKLATGNTIVISGFSGTGTTINGTFTVTYVDADHFSIAVDTSASTVTGTGSIQPNALFNTPCGIIVDDSNNVFVVDSGNHNIRKITSAGMVSTFAGSNASTPVSGFADGTGTFATFTSPNGIAIDSYSNLYIADTGNAIIRKITSDSSVSTIAGKVPVVSSVPNTDVAVGAVTTIKIINHNLITGNNVVISGFTSSGSSINGTFAITYVDADHFSIAVDTTAAVITGTGSVKRIFGGGVDANGTYARFNTPVGLDVDSSGNLFVVDSANNNIRKIVLSSLDVSTFAGYAVPTQEQTSITINNNASYFDVDGAGKYFTLYSANPEEKHYFWFSVSGGTKTQNDPKIEGIAHNISIPSNATAGGSVGIPSIANLISSYIITNLSSYFISVNASYSNELIVTNVSKGSVKDAQINTSGTTMKITQQGVDVSTGSPTGLVNAVGTNARFSAPSGIFTDSKNVMYVSDTGNNIIRKVSSTANVTSMPIYSETLSAPKSIVIDTDNNIYVTSNGNRVLKLSAKSPETVFAVNDKFEILGAAAPFDVLNNTDTTESKKSYTITEVSPNSITFSFVNSDIPADSPSTDTNIYSYSFRNIVRTTQIDITSANGAVFSKSLTDMTISEVATNDVYANIESNVYQIIIKLRAKTSTTLTNYISQALQDTYLKNLNITSAANVNIKITVPEEIKNNKDYFVQVYRTSNFIALQGQSLGVDVVPDDEMNLVYEELLTSGKSEISFTDTYPDDLRGFQTPLYTNPTTGEGIGQANEQPPIAKDINRFKNVVFYANTKTKQRLVGLTLLGTSGINNGDKLLISNADSSKVTQYEFVSGVKQETTYTFTGITPEYTKNRYFTIDSEEDINKYYIWYRLNNKTYDSLSLNASYIQVTSSGHNLSNGDQVEISGITVSSGPEINGIYTINTVTTNTYRVTVSGLSIIDSQVDAIIKPYVVDGDDVQKTPCIVDVLSGESNEVIRNKTLNAINGLSYDFSAVSKDTDKLVITNTKEGIVTYDPTVGTFNSGLTVSWVPGEGEDADNNKILLSQVASRAQAIDITARSLVRVINKNASSAVSAYYGSSANTLPGIINLESKSLVDTAFYIISSTLTSGTSFNPDISPVNSPDQTTSAYITNIALGTGVTNITTNDSHGLIAGDKITIINSGNANINGIYSIFEVLSSTSFSIEATAAATGSITASWSKLSDVVVSTNETKPNRIYYSKLLQPEAVPTLNYLDVGSADKPILRIFPLRDSLFVFKEDGLYRISGENAPFVLTLFDSSCVLIAPDSVSIANNIIYAWTNKGISNVTEAGVNEISRPIDTVILKLASANYANFPSITWGVGYDSDNSYTVYTNTSVDDEYATIAFRYSNLTNTWTNFVRSQTCGVINLKDDKIYTGSGLYNLIDRERKDFSRTDYSDRDFSIAVNDGNISVNYIAKTTTLKITDIDGIVDGDVIVQNQILTIYLFNSLLQKLDLDPATDRTYEASNTITTGANLKNAVDDLAIHLDADNLTATSFVTAISGAATATEAFNIIIDILNLSSTKTTFKNYSKATQTQIFEAVVISSNKKLNTLVLNLPLEWVVGDMRVYKSIPCEIQYAPVTFGDALVLKQIYEATLMFHNKAFTKGIASFSSDLKPEFSSIDFYGQGNGIFGHYSNPGFGFGFFGGLSNGAPFRTIIPRDAQRCRYMNIKFSHNISREIWSLYGITLTATQSTSTRAYR
jgi:hypothetical protein